MNSKHIQSSFAKMGARLKVREIPSRWTLGDRSWISPQDYAIDIRRDGQGQFFELLVPTHLNEALKVTVMQSERRQRHLLLAVQGDKPQLDRFLCGHDEREWFVAAVPGGASSVRQAMEALKPVDIRARQEQLQVPTRLRNRRKNAAFRRQGEWFFAPVLPEERKAINEKFIVRNEPLRRGAGKPHIVEQLYRTGGELVYVCSRHPNGLLEKQYRKLLQSDPAAVRWGWRVMRRNMRVYVRGAVRHPDHATITLPDWHRVRSNTETETEFMRNVAFLD